MLSFSPFSRLGIFLAVLDFDRDLARNQRNNNRESRGSLGRKAEPFRGSRGFAVENR